MIPVYSHRCIPAEPFESGNPIFSMYGADIMIYGLTLSEYFLNEFGPALTLLTGSQGDPRLGRRVQRCERVRTGLHWGVRERSRRQRRDFEFRRGFRRARRKVTSPTHSAWRHRFTRLGRSRAPAESPRGRNRRGRSLPPARVNPSGGTPLDVFDYSITPTAS